MSTTICFNSSQFLIVKLSNDRDVIDQVRDVIQDLDLKAETSSLSSVEIDNRHKAFSDLWGLLRCKEINLFQRSKSRWLKEGDANTSYFHASVKSRGRKNAILALKVGDNWVESVSDVRSEIVDYFRKHFSETLEDRPTLDGIFFQGLTPDEVLELTTPFSGAEIKEVVVSFDGNKSPGPDGFNFSFFKRFWDILKDEVGIMFDQFFVTADLPCNFSSYFITLIPKVDAPKKIGDFRPISLVGSLYKLVSKVLAGRLAKVMPKLISPNQSAFIKGRQLVDGVVAVNEVIDLARKLKRACFIFKVDFEKAYDSVSWSFLDYMMMRFGFGAKWRSWIRACVFNGNLAVLVNGCPTEEINIQRGLKQGDPLAPFLFLLVVEGLSGAIRRAEEFGMFKGFKVGLKVNFAKSSVMGVNVSTEFLDLAERFLHCSVGSIPFIYLGLPVGANPRKESTWKPLLFSLSRKLGVWRNRNDLIFARGTVSVDTLVEKVKLSSWKWFLAKNPGNPCSFYEWEVQPVMCWSR
ncbi:hypothetical protein TSUD_124910 [Trifolium subterraneum]|uniref:Reverse transcriptase domain-containing protein n=1 Tax=Trifolium subterraneum TaxID=3900 RepID=A0A2Z6M8S9_TRISU|nr:hypothetical protein TSUD_124910 [Trifolium subterraneum]